MNKVLEYRKENKFIINLLEDDMISIRDEKNRVSKVCQKLNYHVITNKYDLINTNHNEAIHDIKDTEHEELSSNK